MPVRFIEMFDRFKKGPGRKGSGKFARVQEFVQRHEGIEAYIEPQTTTMSLTVLLVSRDGRWMRVEVTDRGQAHAWAKRLDIPIYDAAIVGYPSWMKGGRVKPAPASPSAEELERWFSEGGAPDEGSGGNGQ